MTRRTGRGEIGQLRVGLIGPAIYSILPVILQEFRQQFPDVELVLQELTTAEQEQALRDRRIDVGFVYLPLSDADLSYLCIHQEALIVALYQTHRLAQQEPIAVQSLANEPVILFPRHLGIGLYDGIMALCQQGNFTSKIAQEAIQMQTIIGLVATGMGVAIVPSSLQNLQRTGLVYQAIESLTNAPWNTITHPQPETRKGCATSLIEELVRESQRLQFNGIVKAMTIPSVRPFYRKIGFIETDGSGEMILTPDTA